MGWDWDILRARKRSSERIAMAFTSRTETSCYEWTGSSKAVGFLGGRTLEQAAKGEE